MVLNFKDWRRIPQINFLESNRPQPFSGMKSQIYTVLKFEDMAAQGTTIFDIEPVIPDNIPILTGKFTHNVYIRGNSDSGFYGTAWRGFDLADDVAVPETDALNTVKHFDTILLMDIDDSTSAVDLFPSDYLHALNYLEVIVNRFGTFYNNPAYSFSAVDVFIPTDKSGRKLLVDVDVNIVADSNGIGLYGSTASIIIKDEAYDLYETIEVWDIANATSATSWNRPTGATFNPSTGSGDGYLQLIDGAYMYSRINQILTADRVGTFVLEADIEYSR